MAAIYDDEGNYTGDDGSSDMSGLYGSGTDSASGGSDAHLYNIGKGTDSGPSSTGDLPTVDTGGGGSTDWGAQIKSVADGLGLTKNGNYDWSKILGLGLAGTQLASSLNTPAYNPRSASSLLAGMPSNTPAAFSGGALSAMTNPLNAGAALKRQTMPARPSSIVPGVRGYAAGGEVEGPLSMVAPPGPSGPGMAPPDGPEQAFSGPVPMDTGGGQDDLFDAKLAGGEFVFDAETVSMMGDGNSQAGIDKLEQLRQQVRDQKRSTPNDQIPAPMQGPLSTMQGPQ